MSQPPSETTTPEILLYGPDKKHGTDVVKKSFKSYIYYLVWYEDGRKCERTTKARFPDRAKAEEALGSALEERKAQRDAPAGGHRAHQIDVGWVLEKYSVEYAVDMTALETIRHSVAAMWPFWHTRLLSEVGEATCDDYTKWRTGQESWHSQQARAAWDRRNADAAAHRRPFDVPKPPVKLATQNTARTELAYLRAAINYCRRRLYITDAPPVTLPAAGEARQVWLTRSEFARMLLAARAPVAGHPSIRRHLIVFLLVGVYHGVRKTAILDLPLIQPFNGGAWIDAERGVVDFGPAVGKKKRPRNAVIHPRVMPYVRAAARRGQTYLIEMAKLKVSETEDGHISKLESSPVNSVRRSFASCVERAGITKHVTPHVLRHTAVSWLKQHGVESFDVGDYVGMSEAMVNNVYGHNDPQHQQRVITAMTGGRRR